MTAGIPFQLDKPGSGASIEYRPWGTSTLKVQVTTQTAMPPLRIRPQQVNLSETACGLFRAFADDSQSFIVSWGGGNEPGPCTKAEDYLMAFEKCVDLLPGDNSVVFFNVSHVGPDVPETAVITLQAYNETSGDVVASLPIQIKRVATYHEDAVQLVAAEPGLWRPQGSRLPTYDPRWWPRPVNYVPAGDLPLTIRKGSNELLVQWQGRNAATVTDHTQPTILDLGDISYELFQFDEWHVALRIWFFWLDKNIGKTFFVGRHEVPDAERFDMLIRRKDGATTLACTDLHWRETWGQVKRGEPLAATLGLSTDTKIKLAKEALGKVWQVWRRDEAVDHKRPYDPLTYIERMAATLGQESVGNVRAKGTEAHLPALVNVETSDQPGRPPRMTSSDVRLG
ncbi:MAG: hypothetical protein H6658_12615 [Ardenticatenaceae bacterium]|nr:hypothetical protein [Ardenticatenaceae bacterium]